MQTKKFITGLLVLASIGLAACASSYTDTETIAPATTTSPTSNSRSATPPPSLHYVGSQVFSGGGTKYTIDYRFGRIGYGQSAEPPVDLSVCGDNSNIDIQSTAFVQGSITVTYNQGSLADSIKLLGGFPFDVVGGGQFSSTSTESSNVDPDLYYNLNDGNGWQCEADGGFNLSMRSGESTTIPIWLGIPDGASNSNPSGVIAQSTLNRWAMDVGFFSEQIQSQTNDMSYAVYGPKAASCTHADGETSGPEILPFAQFPATACKQGAASAWPGTTNN